MLSKKFKGYEQLDTSPANPVKVIIGTPCFTCSMPAEVAGKIGMYLYQTGKKHPEIDIEWCIVQRCFVHTARNQIVQHAIEINADYIWWVDDDCILDGSVDILPRLIAHNKDIVITPYFIRKPPHVPGVLRAKNLQDPNSYWNLTLDDLHKGLIEVDGGGTHCMLTKVSMFKEMPLPYFALPEYGGTEDMYMCLKAREMGVKIYCDSDIEVGHVGYPKIITSKDYTPHKQPQRGTSNG